MPVVAWGIAEVDLRHASPIRKPLPEPRELNAIPSTERWRSSRRERNSIRCSNVPFGCRNGHRAR